MGSIISAPKIQQKYTYSSLVVCVRSMIVIMAASVGKNPSHVRQQSWPSVIPDLNNISCLVL